MADPEHVSALFEFLLDEEEPYLVRSASLSGLRRLAAAGQVDTTDRSAELLARSAPVSAERSRCGCEWCVGPDAGLPLARLVPLFRQREALRRLFRHLETEPVGHLLALLRAISPTSRPAPALVFWLAERISVACTAHVHRVDAAIRMREFGVAFPALDAELVELPAFVLDHPWEFAKRIALALDPNGQPYLDVDRHSAVLRRRLGPSSRSVVLQESYRLRSGIFVRRRFSYLWAFLETWPHGFRFAAHMLDSMTLHEAVSERLAAVMLRHDRLACQRWFARRARQPELQRALRHVIRTLAASEKDPADRPFLEAAVHTLSDDELLSDAREALTRLDAPAASLPTREDLTHSFRRALLPEGSGDVLSRLVRELEPELPRLPDRSAPLPWRTRGPSVRVHRACEA